MRDSGSDDDLPPGPFTPMRGGVKRPASIELQLDRARATMRRLRDRPTGPDPVEAAGTKVRADAAATIAPREPAVAPSRASRWESEEDEWWKRWWAENRVPRRALLYTPAAERAPGQFVYRVEDGRAPNGEFLERHVNCSRGTGHLGTGLYVYLERPDGVGEGKRVDQYAWPWRRPVVLGDVHAFNTLDHLSRFMCAALSRALGLEEPDAARAAVARACRALPVYTDIGGLAVSREACEKEVREAMAEGNTEQPINKVITGMGRDGVVNYAMDTNSFGSVVYSPQPPLPVPQPIGIEGVTQ